MSKNLLVKIAVICMGNICRSPMGEYVLRAEAEKAGLTLEVCSGGTGDWHIGDGAHPHTLRVLAEAGYDGSEHRARQFNSDWFDSHDVILVMDQANQREVLAQARSDQDRAKIKLIRSYETETCFGAEVQDPYGHGIEAYREVFEQLSAAINGLVKRIVDIGV